MLNAKQICSSVIDFWFEGVRETGKVSPKLMKMWFGGSALDADDRIRREYIPISEAIHKDPVLREELCSTAMGMIAAIVLLDQFPRNAFRLDARAFSFDSHALELAKKFIRRDDQAAVHPILESFACMPFEHSEAIEDQTQGVELFSQLLDKADNTETKAMMASFLEYAKAHKTIIERFGRFPHRNRVLGRQSTAEEVKFLGGGGETFSTK